MQKLKGVALFMLVLTCGVYAGHKTAPALQKFEYKVEYPKVNLAFEDTLNERAKEGWDVVSVNTVEEKYYVVTLRRPINP